MVCSPCLTRVAAACCLVCVPQSKVSSSWFYLHVITQICGIVAGLGGFAIALLAFGWKAVPGQALYLPHKWMGIAVLGMVLIQVSCKQCC